MAQSKTETKNDNGSDSDSEPRFSHPAAGFRLYGDFSDGDIVKIKGLVKKSEWNEQYAKIVKYIPDKQRYHILTTMNRSDKKLKCALLREDNLELIYALRYNAFQKQCIVCMKKAEISKSIDCQFCRSIFYCSTKCRKQHFTSSGHLRFMCHDYKKLAEFEHKMISKTEKLFEFRNLIREELQMWLKNYGLLNKSVWKRFWYDINDGFTPYGELMDRFELNKKSKYVFWALGSKKDMKKVSDEGENYVPSVDDIDGKYCVKKDKIIKNWKSYYKLKGVTMKSPISHFMSYILTVYYGLTKYLGLRPILNGSKTINVHLVGAEIELDIKHLFCELLCLLPGYDINIFMFAYSENANLISNKLKQETVYKIPASQNTLKVMMFKAEYKRENVKKLVDSAYRVPHILFGLNAGFEGFPDHWTNALKYIYRKGIPSIFTEYTITTIKSANTHLKEMFGANRKFDEQYKMNPFRSSIVSFNPVSRYCSIQNAWLYTLFTNKLKAK